MKLLYIASITTLVSTALATSTGTNNNGRISSSDFSRSGGQKLRKNELRRFENQGNRQKLQRSMDFNQFDDNCDQFDQFDQGCDQFDQFDQGCNEFDRSCNRFDQLDQECDEFGQFDQGIDQFDQDCDEFDQGYDQFDQFDEDCDEFDQFDDGNGQGFNQTGANNNTNADDTSVDFNEDPFSPPNNLGVANASGSDSGSGSAADDPYTPPSNLDALRDQGSGASGSAGSGGIPVDGSSDPLSAFNSASDSRSFSGMVTVASLIIGAFLV